MLLRELWKDFIAFPFVKDDQVYPLLKDTRKEAPSAFIESLIMADTLILPAHFTQ